MSLMATTVSILARAGNEREPVKQVEGSRSRVHAMVTQQIETLGDVVAEELSLQSERARRFMDGRKGLSERAQAIAAEVASELGLMETKWQQRFDEVLEFADVCAEEKAMIDGFIKRKLDFIKELESEVIARDHEFVNKNAACNEAVNQFIKRLREYETELRGLTNRELNAILSSYEHERATTNIQIERELKQMSARRQERETALMNQTLENRREVPERLQELRAEQAEAYLKTRAEFERRLDAARKELEDRLAQFRFSREQLDYDHRILQENEEEHVEKVKLQNKKMVRQRDTIRALKAQYRQNDEQFQRVNTELTREYKRVAQSYRDLQLRFRNVAYTDFNAFREVWNLSERRLHERVCKLIDAVRVVYEQQLGKPAPVFEGEQLRRWVLTSEEFDDLTKTPQVAQPKVEEPTTSVFISEALEHLRRMLTDEAGFLVEDRVKGIIGDAESVKLAALMNELGVTRDEDVQKLLEFFIKPSEFGELETPVFVRPHELLAGLRSFVDNFSPQRQKNQATLFSQITADATQNTSSEVARAVLELQARLKKQLPAQREFWQRKSAIITPRLLRILRQTSSGLVWYHGELQSRAHLIEAVDSMRRQNAELERLLARYLQAEGSSGLIFTPGETVDFYET